MNDKYLFLVSVRFVADEYPCTGFRNTVEASTPFEALEKALTYHNTKNDKVISFTVEYKSEYPLIP